MNSKELNKRYVAMDHSYEAMSVDENYFDENDLAKGTYGEDIDKYLGKIPIDGPDGFIFRKVTYENNASSSTECLGTFRADASYRGVITMMNGGTRTDKTINDDARGGSALSGQNRLRSGDIILASILEVIDGREEDVKSGAISGGFVPISSVDVNSGNFHYGVFSPGNDSNIIITTSVGGSKTFAANRVSAFSVANRSFDIYNAPRKGSDALGGTDNDTLAVPAHAIAIDGMTASDAIKVKYKLTVYALMGARNSGLIEPGSPDPDFKLECLIKKRAKHHVNVIL